MLFKNHKSYLNVVIKNTLSLLLPAFLNLLVLVYHPNQICIPLCTPKSKLYPLCSPKSKIYPNEVFLYLLYPQGKLTLGRNRWLMQSNRQNPKWRLSNFMIHSYSTRVWLGSLWGTDNVNNYLNPMNTFIGFTFRLS